MSRMMRGRGPIVVDLDEVDHLAPAALLVLPPAAEDARSAGRQLTVRNLDPSVVRPSASLRLVGG
jgi:anti-anti-sigma regulatory factor